ncbi:MAG: thioredoxin family protein [Puniceicoccales bacterium]|nr:thioredoxin family protein [Puniceicoccales bacterium]
MTAEEFDAALKDAGVVFVEFYTDRAPPKAPVLDELAAEFAAPAGTAGAAPVVIARFNLSRARAKAREHGIKNVPTFVVFKNGIALSTFVGVRSKAVFADAIQSAR